MDLSAIRSGLQSWIEALTGLPVYWRSRAQNWQGAAWIELRIISPVAIGRDSLTYREDVNDLYPRQIGLRSFILEIQVWSHNFADDLDSLHYSEIIRDSLIHSWAEFKEIGVGFGDILSTASFEQALLRREADMVQLDVLFHADSSRENATPTTWIETVDMSGDLGDDGTIEGIFP